MSPDIDQTGQATEPTTAVERPVWLDDSIKRLEAELVAAHGEASRARTQRGLRQVASFWRSEDGGAEAFESLVRAHFSGDQRTLDEMFSRFERLMEQIDGHMNEMVLAFRQQADLDRGPVLPFDEIFAGYDPAAHLTSDLFDNQLAFVALLNFPLTTLADRLTEGEQWTRRQWAEARLTDRFSKRVPAEANQAMAQAVAAAEQYIAQYNIWMHHLIDARGQRLFPAKLRLLSHWNLRDEIKAQYSDADGLPRQRMIQQVMERIVTQTIPAVVVDGPHVDWNPTSNTVAPAAVSDASEPPPADLKVTADPEPDTRYAMLLGVFEASRKVDPYSPTAPTLIARRFDEDRELPEARVAQMFETLLKSPLRAKAAAVIEARLGRPLEPFDIWYAGFRPRGAYSEAELDAIVRTRYPTAAAYEKDIPNLLRKLGFSPGRAGYLAERITVEAARGSGHAWPAGMRSARTRLRTRVESTGMNYKGFNIAVHEMGHNVEQVFSLYDVDHTLLQGVPNTAFTEALAFVFQDRDFELLGLAAPDARTDALQTLDDFWGASEIAGVALVDMRVWHWMYDHPDATPAALKAATIQTAKDVWNEYFAPIFKTRDVVLLGIYSHMIDSLLYLPDYPIGHMIARQIEEHLKKAGPLGPEFERMATYGAVAPDLWMKHATGAPVGPEALIQATERALQQIGS